MTPIIARLKAIPQTINHGRALPQSAVPIMVAHWSLQARPPDGSMQLTSARVKVSIDGL